MNHQRLIFTNDIAAALDSAVAALAANRLFLLTDDNTLRHAVPLLSGCRAIKEAVPISVRPGDMNKNLDAAQRVWQAMEQHGATRKSALINLGGGVVTDLGGFAAATFKRGIRFINVPTTLLGAVDAAVGGKTGVNFNGLKNEIGVFREAESVVISTKFFQTLPATELRSGYAEMIKHGLLSGKDPYRRLLDFDLVDTAGEHMLSLLEESVGIKRDIVEKDPFEKGLRRALNLGHTAGHAFESMALFRNAPVPHGYAVAWGLVVEAVLSHTEKGLPSSTLYGLADYVRSHYGAFRVTCDDYPELLEFMRRDKKSENGEFNFSLLSAIGKVETGCRVEKKEVETALDIYRDLMHI